MNTTTPTIRPPAVAGAFYSDRPDKLAAAVDTLLGQAQDAGLGPVRALIAPHAGYRYSGPIAASAFRQLAAGRQRRTPHGLPAGPGPLRLSWTASLCRRPTAFATPLGLVAQNRAAIDALLASSRAYQLDSLAHEPEHSLEVELPFLQVALADFDLVAMLCGQPDVEQVAADLAGRLRPNDLVVVSSDLSHFYPYETAQASGSRLSGGCASRRHGRVRPRAKPAACSRS